MPIQVDWDRNPISIRCEDKSKLSILLIFLKEKGIKKHSIIMPDRENGGFLFFVYGKLEKSIIEKWNSEGE